MQTRNILFSVFDLIASYLLFAPGWPCKGSHAYLILISTQKGPRKSLLQQYQAGNDLSDLSKLFSCKKYCRRDKQGSVRQALGYTIYTTSFTPIQKHVYEKYKESIKKS